MLRRSAGAPRGAPSAPPCSRVRARGTKVASAHLVHLNPFPANLGEVLRRYPQVLVPEMNLGQLSRCCGPSSSSTPSRFTKVQGLPFTAAEIEAAIVASMDALTER